MDMEVEGLSSNVLLVYSIWYIITLVQMFMGYGSAYRATKKGGDNGVALFGWLFVYALAAMVPGLGFYLWKKSKQES